jgi:hypothetical protein
MRCTLPAVKFQIRLLTLIVVMLSVVGVCFAPQLWADQSCAFSQDDFLDKEATDFEDSVHRVVTLLLPLDLTALQAPEPLPLSSEVSTTTLHAAGRTDRGRAISLHLVGTSPPC